MTSWRSQVSGAINDVHSQKSGNCEVVIIETMLWRCVSDASPWLARPLGWLRVHPNSSDRLQVSVIHSSIATTKVKVNFEENCGRWVCKWRKRNVPRIGTVSWWMDERWWCRWLMSHGPATGAVIDGPLNHFAAATCRQAVSTWMGPHRASHSAYPAKITGRTATTTPHHTTRRNVWLTSLANFLTAQSCVVWRQFKSNHRLPPASFLLNLFAYIVLFTW